MESGLQTLSDIKNMLGQYGMHPKKALGQNFLIDQNLVAKLVDSAGVGEGDTVLEVGPGTGTLTDELVDRGCRVIASELDDSMCDLLGDRFGGRVELIRGDCLEKKSRLSADVRTAVAGEAFTLVANLPYGCATPLLMTLLTRHPECRGMFVTVQEEVGDRLRATPADGKAYGAISVAAQWLCSVEKIARLRPGCFWPAPDVTSAMIGLRRKEVGEPERWAEIAEIVRTLFQSRRKQIGSSMKKMGAGGAALPGGVGATMRPEAVGVEPLIEVARAIFSEMG